MAALVLVIGNRNYSSWSLRPWLALRAAGLDFAVERIALYQPGFEEKLRRFSATGLVPVLVEDGTAIWESLAICERVAELAPAAGLWPDDPVRRAVARAVATEIHGGFTAIRQALPMNFRAGARRRRGRTRPPRPIPPRPRLLRHPRPPSPRRRPRRREALTR